jgi:hypothetical protein
VVGTCIQGTDLYVLLKDTGSVSLEKINLDFQYVQPEAGNDSLDSACLDRRALVTGVYDSETGDTDFVLPYYEWYDQDDIVLIDPETGFHIEGYLSGDNQTFKVDGDMDGKVAIAGLKYTSRYELSRWCLKPEKQPPFLEAPFRMRGLALSFKDTGYYRVEYVVTQRPTMETYYEASMTSDYTATVLGESVLGTVELRSGVHRFRLNSKPVDTKLTIVNDSYLPMQIQTGEYSGFYGGRNKRV